MKIRISATIDEKTDKILESILKEGTFRNKSHLIEEAIKKFQEAKNDKIKK